MKSVWYMSGTPRSGSTLLASILNQNKQIYVTPQTDNPEIIRTLLQEIVQRESFLLGTMTGEYDSLISNYLDAFYEARAEKYIIDKNCMWGVPYQINVHMAYRKTPPKILFPYRPLIEIMASYIQIASTNPNNWIDRDMSNSDFFPYHHKHINDARVDWLLRPGGQIDTSILAARQAFDSEYSDYFLPIEYKELVAHPNKVIEQIYTFLDIPEQKHRFTNLEDQMQASDQEYFGVRDLHHVRSKMSISKIDAKSILSNYAMERCKSEDFWTPQT